MTKLKLFAVAVFVAIAATSLAQPPQLNTMYWNRLCGVNPANDDVRNMDVSPSGLIATVNRNAPADAVKLFDARTGIAYDKMANGGRGYLKMTGIAPGTYNLIKGKWDDEGAFYACSLAYTSPLLLKVYRWANIDADPVEIANVYSYLGYRMGDAIDVIGKASDNTVKVIVSGNNALSQPLVLTTSDNGASFTSATLANPVRALDIKWRSDGDFYACFFATPTNIQRYSGATGAPVGATAPDLILATPAVAGIDLDETNGIIYGVGSRTDAQLYAYDQATGAQICGSDELVDAGAFLAGVANGSGSVSIAPDGRVCALSERNGVGSFMARSYHVVVDGVASTTSSDTLQTAFENYSTSYSGIWTAYTPLTISIDPALTIDESLDLNDDPAGVGGCGALAGDMFVKSLSNTTPATIKLQKGITAFDDGIYIYQTTASLAFKNLILCPSQNGTVFVDDMLKVDENVPNTVANWTEWHKCVMTDIDTSGVPLATSAAEVVALADQPPPPTGSGLSWDGDVWLKHWDDNGESTNCFVDECASYGGWGFRLHADGAAGSQVVVYNSQSVRGGTTGGFGASFDLGTNDDGSMITVAGEDAGQGPLKATAGLQPGWHPLYLSGAPATAGGAAVRVSNFIGFADRDASSRGISGSNGYDIQLISDSIISCRNYMTVLRFANSTIERTTFHHSTSGGFNLFQVGGSTYTDCIWSGPGTVNFATLTSDTLNNCSIVASGPNATTGKSGATIETGTITWDPAYVATDQTAAEGSTLLDVQNTGYAGAAAGGANLAGGADYVGGVAPSVALRDSGDTAPAPNPVDFGSVFVGDNTSATVLVKNEGPGEPLVVNSVTMTGSSDYAITGDSGEANITNGSSRSLQITFAPSAAGNPITGTVEVWTNAGGGGGTTSTINLTGSSTGTGVEGWRQY